jgi:hypothetical protein
MKNIVMAAHQPNFLPYLGFFDKIKNCDVFVIRDEVQFVKRDYHHRNRILFSSDPNAEPKPKWIRIPAEKRPCELRDTLINNKVKDKNVPWNVFLLRQIKSSYQKAVNFNKYYPLLEQILLPGKEKLIDINMEIINYLCLCFGIHKKIILASDLGLEKTNDTSHDLAQIAQAVGANIYLSGSGAKVYLKNQIFEENGICVRYQQFTHPVYRQFHPNFIENLAAIDALFCAGNVLSEAVRFSKLHRIMSYKEQHQDTVSVPAKTRVG